MHRGTNKRHLKYGEATRPTDEAGETRRKALEAALKRGSLMIGDVKRLVDVARAVWLALMLLRHDRWSQNRLARHQQELLDRLVYLAVTHSAFYRRLYRDIELSGPIRLVDLPVIDKAAVMDNFDDLVTDPRLSLVGAQSHLNALMQDDYYLGDYRVLATAGTTGRRGIFVFDRAAWCHVLADALRWQRFMGLWPTWPRRLRFCTIDAPGPTHVSARMTETGNVGLFRFLRLRATQSLPELVAALNEYCPDVLITYPSLAVLLAGEQLHGDLSISPRRVSTHGELLTSAMADTIVRAWQCRPFDHYGLTELPNAAIECCAHQGLHLLSDQAIIEVVDDNYRPVAPGELGSKTLVTSLYNHAQPLIRYEVSDLLVISPRPCLCGRPFPLIERIEGRSGEIIELTGRAGGVVKVPPIVLLAVLDSDDELRESRLTFRDRRLLLEVVPEVRVDRDSMITRLYSAFEALFARLGALEPEIEIRCVERLERRANRMGKIERVRSGNDSSECPADGFGT